nr:reverse transcriptase domain-containing protein, chloroplastic [Tanacetum cinerariifolium]
MKTNTASSSGSETLPGNTITNPKEDLKGITTRSGTAYQGPTIPTTSLPLVVERETEATKDTVHPTNNASTEDVQPPIVPTESLILNSEPVINPITEPVASPVSDLNFNISFADALILMPKFGPSIKCLLTNKDKLCELARTPLNEHCSAVLLKKLPEKLGDPGKFLIPCDFRRMAECLALADLDASINLMTLSTGRALINVFEGELTLRVGKEAITFNHDQTSRYSANYNDMTANRIDVIDMACEDYSQEVLGFFDVIASGNPTPYYDLIVATTSLTLTPFENSEFLLEEVDAFLALEDDPTSLKVDQSYVDTEGDILLLEAFLNDDPSLPPSNQGNYLPQVKTALITVLKSHKQAIAWKLSDIKGIDLEFCTHKILMEEDFKLAVQHWRRVNPKIHDVIKNEVLKLLDARLIYLISDSPWLSPVHRIPKKGGFTVVENEKNELILTRFVTGWRVRVDYRKLNEATNKDHFPLPFMDQMLKRLARNQYYCFLDGFSGIEVDKAKVDVIAKLPHPTTLKGIRSFLGHAGFYRRFIQDFSKIARPMNHLLEKDTSFLFSKECVESFQTLKRNLTKAPILIAPDWDMPFDLMCDASDFTIGAILRQRQEKHFRPIHYASKTMTEAKSNYTTTEKEMLAVVFQGKIAPLVLLLQEFTFKVNDTKGAKNLAADLLSRLENPHQNVLDPKEINVSFPLETLNLVSSLGNSSTSWFADFTNYHAGNFVVKGI